MKAAGNSEESIRALADSLSTDWRAAELGPTDREMLCFAVLLTTTRAAIHEADIDRLRTVGLGDREIHDLCAIVAYFNFVNRIAIGLGVELEDRFR